MTRFGLGACLVLTGSLVSSFSCVGGQVSRSPLQTQSSQPERVYRKTYELGQQLSAVVGEKILSVRDYTVIKTRETAVRPSVDFRLDAGDVHVDWYAAKDYPLFGKWTYAGVEYRAVEIPGVRVPVPGVQGMYGVLLPILDDGRPLNVVAYAISGSEPLHADFSPEAVVFRPSVAEHVDPAASFLNFELLYGGTDGRSFTITYREYSRDDLLKPGFSQNLIYPNSSSTVRFRNIRIRVVEVNGERIVFVVEADDLTS